MDLKKEKIDGKEVLVQIVELADGIDIVFDKNFINKLEVIGIKEKDLLNANIKTSLDNFELALEKGKTISMKISRFKKSYILSNDMFRLAKGFVYYFYDNKNAKRYPLVDNVSYFKVNHKTEYFLLTSSTIILEGLPIFFVKKDGLPITLEWLLDDKVSKLKEEFQSSSRQMAIDIESPHASKMMGVYNWLKDNFWLLLFENISLILIVGIIFFTIGQSIGGV